MVARRESLHWVKGCVLQGFRMLYRGGDISLEIGDVDCRCSETKQDVSALPAFKLTW